MSGLILHQSNRLEVLADQFAGMCADSPGDPFASEKVVVQNAGMARWLSLRLADKAGIAANLAYPFPAEFSWSLMREVLGGLPETAPFSPGPLAWRIMAELEQNGAEYAELQISLDKLNQQGVFQLARQLERLFDRYLFYRPKWIQRWEAGKDDHWQARMWRALREAAPGAKHWLDLQDDFLAKLPQAADALPARVSFFGISELSPGYLRLLHASARYMDIHVFVMNPCEQYWGDIESEKHKLEADDELEPYLEIGNPLLASLGRQGRDFIDLLAQEDRTQEQTHFVQPEAETLLAQIQRDILNLVDRGGENAAPPLKMQPDSSLQIHACHTITREVEVLHDQLLAMLDAGQDVDGGLQPADIIVMMPSVDDYASAVEAVFSAAPQQIPYSIADRKVLDATTTGRIFRQLLDVPDSRYEVNRVLDLVEAEPLQQRFGLDDEATERVRQWCKVLRVRWGIDGQMRRDMDLPDSDEHSWRAAIRRLLLGYMLDQDELYQGILPYREVEGAAAVDLGRFVTLLEKLFALRRWRNRKLSVEDWFERFAGMLDDFFEPGEAVDDIQMIRTALARIAQQTRQASYQGEVDFDLARKLVLDALGQENGGSRFITGGVTFCELAPMRSVPFKVVCLLGMDDGKFPHPQRRVSFDLMADRYLRGDRSSRLQERYLFLESLLAARRRLYISFIGQNVITNKELPPSVLVSELLDFVRKAYGVDPESLLTKQALQAFSRRYVASGKLFTYADFGVARRGDDAALTRPLPVFADKVIDAPSSDVVYLDDLENFIVHPVRYFLHESLGLARFRGEQELDEREPFALGPFEPKDVRQALDRISDDFAEQRLRAQGLLPHGAVGEIVLAQQQAALETLRARLPECAPEPPLSFNIELDDKTLAGTLEGQSGQGMLLMLYDKPYHHDLLRFWVRHLAMQLQRRGSSRLIYPDGEVALQPVENADEHMQGLLDAWEQGRHRPLHFMRKSAFAWAKASRGGRTPPEQSARTVWNNSRNPESADLAYQIAFRGLGPDDLFDAEFAHWAGVLWDGYLEAGGVAP